MKYLFSSVLIYLFSHPLYADIIGHFRQDDGHTDWQHVANWSSGILILLLSITAIILAFSRRQIRQANHELMLTRQELEQRVLNRTATLDKSNQLLVGEIQQHRVTTDQLRSSEAYITDILSSMPLMLIGLDQAGEITQWNQRTVEVTGITSKNAVGKDLWQVYPMITITPDQIRDAQTQAKPITIKHSQRGQYHFDITIYPLQEKRNIGVVILIDDVTEHILRANKLIQKDKLSAMGELASTMAYDINPPVQAILSNTKKIIDAIKTNGELDQKQATKKNQLKEWLYNIEKQGQQSLAIINNLLGFANSQGGRKQVFSITDIIDNALLIAKDVISVVPSSNLCFSDITIKRMYQCQQPNISCFVSELQQVFLSLFRHACHALGEVNYEGFIPTINIQVLDECYDALWIKVQHNGLGISSEEQQFIFEPFFHNKSNATHNDKVHENQTYYDAAKRLSFSYFIITEQHHGQLAITSDIAIGTTFHIQLPLS